MSDFVNSQNFNQLLEEAIKLLSELEQALMLESNPRESHKLELQIQQTKDRINHLQAQQKLMAATKQPELYFQRNYINLSDTGGALIGREAELQKLTDLLKDGGCAAVLGVGGQGKTALAYTYIKPYLNGPGKFERVAWLTVEGNGSDLNTLVGQLSLPTTGRPDETAETVRQYLTTHPALVVLDNFDSAIGENQQLPLDVEALLKRIAELRGQSHVLITSRELPPRYHPKRLPLEGLTSEAGADLLAEQGLDFEPRPKLLKAAHKASGHPFGLKLLADLVINSAGDSLDDLLQQGDLWDKEVAERLLGKVWNSRLNDQERRLLQILAVLRPPARRPALLHLMNGPDERQLRELLNDLAAKALVTVEYHRKEPNKALGYDLHPLLRRFVLNEKLPGEAFKEFHSAANEYFQSQIPNLPTKENYRRKSVEDTWAVLEAIYHLNELEEYETACDLFFKQELHEDLSRWGEATLRIIIYEQWANINGSPHLTSKWTLGAIFGNLGLAYSDLGQDNNAIDYYQQALTIAQEVGNRRGEGNNLSNMGRAYYNLGRIDIAIDYYQQALTIAQEVGDRRGESNRLGSLGIAYYNLGQVDKAIEYHQKALAIAQKVGNRRGEGNRLGSLGLVYSDLGQIDKAIEYYQKALTIVQEIGDRRNESIWLGNLGNAYGKQRELLHALAYWRRTEEIFRKIKSPNANKVQDSIDELRQEQGEEEFARLWAESETEYQALKRGEGID